jgi:hypothetical protein
MLTKSKDFLQEYCATVVKIGTITPIEGTDFLGTTLVNGFSIIVRKDLIHEGDIMIYCPIETQLNAGFLSTNNLYEWSHRHLNQNYEKVEDCINQDGLEVAKKMVGFFNKYGRVRILRLKGQASMGYLTPIQSLYTWGACLSGVDWENCIGMDFDEVNGERFIQVYIPPIKPQSERLSKDQRRNKRIEKIDRMIPGEFSFHYDTQQLNRNIHRFNPEDIVDISVKMHGTSICLGNVLVKKPKQFKFKPFNWIHSLLPLKWQKLIPGYDIVYSSRTVIKNSDLNSTLQGGYYSKDVWGDYAKLLGPYIPEGMEIFGEIVGYVTDTQTPIQKGYDYKCLSGKNRLYIYRIRTKQEDGTHKEWDLQDIRVWLQTLVGIHQELEDQIDIVPILYHGSLSYLYPEIPTDHHWHENILAALKQESVFGMEKLEPLCNNKTPREGIVLRIEGDPIAEAFKLKCISFLEAECRQIDKGEIDIELKQSYSK